MLRRHTPVRGSGFGSGLCVVFGFGLRSAFNAGLRMVFDSGLRSSDACYQDRETHNGQIAEEGGHKGLAAAFRVVRR